MANNIKKIPNVHPGEILKQEFLKPLGITRYRLAKDIGVPATRIAEICQEKRAISADTALRLGRYFSTTAKFWLGLQADYDLEEEMNAKAAEIAHIEPCGARSSNSAG